MVENTLKETWNYLVLIWGNWEESNDYSLLWVSVMVHRIFSFLDSTFAIMDFVIFRLFWFIYLHFRNPFIRIHEHWEMLEIEWKCKKKKGGGDLKVKLLISQVSTNLLMVSVHYSVRIVKNLSYWKFLTLWHVSNELWLTWVTWQVNNSSRAVHNIPPQTQGGC